MMGRGVLGGGGSTGAQTSTGLGGKPKAPSGFSTAQNFTPQQMQLFQQLFGHLGPESFTSRLAGGDQSAFGEIEAPALQQFNALQGGLASRFSGMGTGGRKSSGFQNTSSQAASDFAQQLSSQRQGLQRQALQDLMGYSESLLNQRPYSFYEKPSSFSQQLFGGLSGGIGQALGSFGHQGLSRALGWGNPFQGGR